MGVLDGKVALLVAGGGTGSAPGVAAGPFFSPYVASKGGSAGLGEFPGTVLQHRIPVGRAGPVDDFAAACLYLAPDAARDVTGSSLAVDGGWTAS